jgi:hypothetical protein
MPEKQEPVVYCTPDLKVCQVADKQDPEERCSILVAEVVLPSYDVSGVPAQQPGCHWRPCTAHMRCHSDVAPPGRRLGRSRNLRPIRQVTQIQPR